MPSTNDAGETIEAAAARLLRILDERAARRRQGIAAPAIAPTMKQLAFDLACEREIKKGQR